MPRRYLDFSGEYIFWKKISTFGAHLSTVSFLFFIFIIFERIIRERKVILVRKGLSKREWGRIIFHRKINGLLLSEL
jgi:heme/copper-type cytochrome/quinol oxidase subunit 1